MAYHDDENKDEEMLSDGVMEEGMGDEDEEESDVGDTEEEEKGWE